MFKYHLDLHTWPSNQFCIWMIHHGIFIFLSPFHIGHLPIPTSEVFKLNFDIFINELLACENIVIYSSKLIEYIFFV
jgi:hypothetical protein